MKNHKVTLKHESDGWVVRCGNEYFHSARLLIFVQLTGDEDGALHGVGVVEPYGHDTLVVRNGEK